MIEDLHTVGVNTIFDFYTVKKIGRIYCMGHFLFYFLIEIVGIHHVPYQFFQLVGGNTTISCDLLCQTVVRLPLYSLQQRTNK